MFLRNFILTCSILVASAVAAAPAAKGAKGTKAAKSDGSARVFRAGAATSNVTPPLGSSMHGSMQDKIAKNIHDELHARCLVLDDGTNKLAFVVVDNCVIPREAYDAAKKMASEATGIPTANMMMSATHTHTSPTTTPAFRSRPDPKYVEFLVRRIADGIRRANNVLEPAKIGWGRGSVPGQVFQRRWFVEGGAPNPFGGIDQVKMNPLGVKQIKPAGPTDPEVMVIAVQSASGRPISVFANYSLHYVGGTNPGDASADYYGFFADRVMELLKADRQDPPFVAMMSNGTSGNINNVNSAVPRLARKPYEQMRKVAHDVADEVVKVHQKIEYRDWVPLQSVQKEITLGVRLPRPEEVERARGIVKQATGKGRNKDLQSIEEGYALETIDLTGYPEKVSLILQAMRLGDLAITAIPCEVFVEIGLELKKRSPFPTSFTVSLANGYNGYLPTPEHHAIGGYETWRAKSSYLEVGASPQIVSTLMELVTDLHRPQSQARESQ